MRRHSLQFLDWTSGYQVALNSLALVLGPWSCCAYDSWRGCSASCSKSSTRRGQYTTRAARTPLHGWMTWLRRLLCWDRLRLTVRYMLQNLKSRKFEFRNSTMRPNQLCRYFASSAHFYFFKLLFVWAIGNVSSTIKFPKSFCKMLKSSKLIIAILRFAIC